eukprot:7378024-Prymnesium_polylepis.3
MPLLQKFCHPFRTCWQPTSCTTILVGNINYELPVGRGQPKAFSQLRTTPLECGPPPVCVATRCRIKILWQHIAIGEFCEQHHCDPRMRIPQVHRLLERAPKGFALLARAALLVSAALSDHPRAVHRYVLQQLVAHLAQLTKHAHVREAVRSARAEQPEATIKLGESGAQQAYLVTLAIRMLRLQPAVRDCNNGEQPVDIVLATKPSCYQPAETSHPPPPHLERWPLHRRQRDLVRPWRPPL